MTEYVPDSDMKESNTVEWASVDIVHKGFRLAWRGYAPREVEAFLQQIAEEVQRLQVDNANLRKDVQRYDKELKEYKEREKIIRNVLVNAQKAVEQMKANADKEARLIVADAELKAEKILQRAQQRVSKMHEEISELRAHRFQLETKLRSTIETYQQILNMDKEEEPGDAAIESKVTALNR